MGQSSSSSKLDHTSREDEIHETLKLRRLFHSLARSLEGGTATRPGLPVEVVIYILRLAGCILPCTRLSVSANTSCRAEAMSGEKSCISWFKTPPFDRHVLSRAATIQLLTTSRDQGWCSNPDRGSWSWFEIAILFTRDGQEPTLKEVDGAALVWKSHENPLEGRDFSQLSGVVFDTDHEIWEHLAEGDMLEVRACAQYGGWCNNAQAGMLRIMEWFEPTLPPRPA